MRDVAIYSNPVAEPGVCSKCGSQHRDWFIDLGFEIEGTKDSHIGPMWYEGVTYICCECWNSLINDVGRKFAQYADAHTVKVNPNGIGFVGSSADADGNPEVVESIVDEVDGDPGSDGPDDEQLAERTVAVTGINF